MKENARKVPSACERCRKQKLKCDIERPCTLCVRANVECIAAQTDRWRFHHPSQNETFHGIAGAVTKRRRLHRAGDESSSVPAYVPASVPASAPASVPASRSEEAARPSSLDLIVRSPSRGHNESTGDTPWNASSTITLVEEAFHHHEAPSPGETETSAFLASTWAHSKPRSPGQRQLRRAPSPLQRQLSQRLQTAQNHQAPRSRNSLMTEQELLLLLPELEAATILVENYFDRIHWFTLLFHQRDFRNKFQNLYSHGLHPSSQTTLVGNRIGYAAVLLAVFATSLHYTNAEQKRLLLSLSIDAASLKEKILTGLKLRFLDIISLGSLEVVQMCLLLGSYYLYHGEPEMAWPLCGSGLRIAQALNLHRKVPTDSSDDESLRHTIEDRKRAWWAIYEIETFCSMLYGFPLSITDSDCDVSPLNPYDEYSRSIPEGQHCTKPNLLFFKCAMSKLSAIVKSALDNLYGPRYSESQHCQDQASRLKSLVNEVSYLNSKLLKWNESLAPILKFDNTRAAPIAGDQLSSSPDMSEAQFEEHLFGLQSLSLKLAYENARILIHRPLLSFRMPPSSSTSPGDGPSHPDPFQIAMHTCRDAALQISQVGSTTYLREASETYAIAFVSLHLLTAGATLCISITLDPLSLKAYESKMGIRRLMQIQTMLKDKSIVAAQGLVITKRLMSLVMAKEVDAMFEVGPPVVSAEQSTSNKSAQANQSGCTNTKFPEAVPMQMSIPPGQQSMSTISALCPLESPEMPTDAIGTEFDGQFYGFCENTSMAEAVLEYEQAITNSLSTDLSNEPVFDNQQDIFVGNTSLGQEQGWIWGWDFLG